MRIVLSLLVVGCSGGKTTSPPDTSGPTTDTAPTTDTTTTPTNTQGACGEHTSWNVSIAGTIERPSHQPAEGATVELEERVWNNPPKSFGTVTTDAYGHFQIDAQQILSIEGCWGILLDYHLTAELGPGSADSSVNQSLYNAIQDGTLFADLQVPITLEASGSGT
jgi:hypothetical protein